MIEMKKLILALAGAACLAAPVVAQSISAPRHNVSTQYIASVEGFNLMKSALVKAIGNVKAANSADALSKAVYTYIKSYLPMNKYYSDLTAAQKKQIDTLQRQVGLHINAKQAKYACKKAVDAAINKATLEAMAAMK